MKISIIIPCLNNDNNITDLHKKISKVLNNIKYEIIFINNDLNCDTKNELNKIYENDVQHTKVINLSKDFGIDGAILAGLKNSCGEYVCVIDKDVSNIEMYIDDMYTLLESDSEYDIISLINEKNKSCLGLKLINKYCDIKYEDLNTIMRMFRSNVKDCVLDYCMNNMYSNELFSFIGFSTKYLPVKEEYVSKSSLKDCFDILLRYSDIVLKSLSRIGITSIVVSIIYLIIFLVLVLGVDIEFHFGHILIIIILLLFGIQSIILSVVGKYIVLNNKNYSKSKFYIKNKLGFEEETIL